MPISTRVAAPATPEDNQKPFRSEDARKPFLIELERLDETPGGSFRPDARLILTPALRTSGLWHALPGEEMKTLLLVLTFLSPNGWCQPTLGQLSTVMQISEVRARSRLERLTQIRWKEMPVVTELKRESGLDAWVPAPTLFDIQEAPPASAARPSEALPRPAGREAVIAWSRAHYAHPRAEVEQEIAERMGWAPPSFDRDDPATAEGKRQAYRQMTNLGVPKEQVVDLLARHDLGEIERQLTWLAHRAAKQPARYLVAAIEGHYEMPASLRRYAPPMLSAAEASVIATAPSRESPPGSASVEEAFSNEALTEGIGFEKAFVEAAVSAGVEENTSGKEGDREEHVGGKET